MKIEKRKKLSIKEMKEIKAGYLCMTSHDCPADMNCNRGFWAAVFGNAGHCGYYR